MKPKSWRLRWQLRWIGWEVPLRCQQTGIHICRCGKTGIHFEGGLKKARCKFCGTEMELYPFLY